MVYFKYQHFHYVTPYVEMNARFEFLRSGPFYTYSLLGVQCDLYTKNSDEKS